MNCVMKEALTADAAQPTTQPPYCRLWSACLFGFVAIVMTMHVMPAFAHERQRANAVSAGLPETIRSLVGMLVLSTRPEVLAASGHAHLRRSLFPQAARDPGAPPYLGQTPPGRR